MMRVLRRVVLGMCVVTTLCAAWFVAGGSFGVDRWLNVTEPPVPAEAIVVLGGGTNGKNLPLPQGWDRLGTAAELFRDGFAPVVIFSGGGTSGVAEAEIYANAGAWLGIPRSAMSFESKAQGTADHGAALLDIMLPNGRGHITRATPLLVVTSAFHSRRALMSFHRAGFTHVRIVSSYSARAAAPAGTPAALTSTIPTHKPSGKQYNDILFRLAYRSFDLFIGLREVAAIMVS
jgi:uncharacterized SAM-binding protein YcdF (DUF218 family)